MPKSKVKGGGTKKVCLPASKVRSMSKAEKEKVIRAKRSAAKSGKYKRSSKSNVKGARKKGATLRDWFEKENWINVAKACSGGKEKIIRFGQQGVSTAGKPKKGESAKQKARRKSFKARHAKNIAKGKMSAAYWADKVKW